ncbi:MAG: TorF family putative porin [Pseudomonadales bacterium]|nr:TorF family putative porin [Pseudomonadales bacterium]
MSKHSIALLFFLSPVAVAEPAVQSALLPAVTIASEHRFNGLSLTDRNPALQLSLHYWRSDGWYAGVWMTNVNFLDAHNTTLEVDTYVGSEVRAGSWRVKIQGLYSAFDDHEPGPAYDFFQAKVEGSRTCGKTTLIAGVKWSPSGSFGAGRIVQMQGQLRYALTPWLDAEASLGRGFYARSNERTYWQTGLHARWRRMHFELLYMGLRSDLPLCGFVDWCEPGFVGRITLATY